MENVNRPGKAKLTKLRLVSINICFLFLYFVAFSFFIIVCGVSAGVGQGVRL